MTCVGDTRKCEMLSRKNRALQGFVGMAVTVSCRSCVSVCGGVGDNERAGMFSQFALVFVFPATRGLRWCRHNLACQWRQRWSVKGKYLTSFKGMVSDCFVVGKCSFAQLSVLGRHYRF